MHPQTVYGHTVAMVEILVGLMSLAVITGLMFARFSRPRARFLFSKNMVVRFIDGAAHTRPAGRESAFERRAGSISPSGRSAGTPHFATYSSGMRRAFFTSTTRNSTK